MQPICTRYEHGGGLTIIIAFALLSLVMASTIELEAYGDVPYPCWTNRSMGQFYTITFVERNICGYADSWSVFAQGYSPTCTANTTGNLLPNGTSATVKLPAGRYWYQYDAWAGPFSGGVGNFTVSGPTTIYLNYTPNQEGYCASRGWVSSNTLNLAQKTNQPRSINPLVQPQQLYNVTFNERGLNTSATWTVSVVNQNTGSNQTKNATYPGSTSITFQLSNGYYSFGSYATFPYGSGGVGFFTVNDTPRTFNLTFMNEEGPICTIFTEFAQISAGGNPLETYSKDVGGLALSILKLFGYCNTSTNVMGTGTSSTISSTTSTSSITATSTATTTISQVSIQTGYSGCVANVKDDTVGLGTFTSVADFVQTAGVDCALGAGGVPGGLHQLIAVPIENAIPGKSGEIIGEGAASSIGSGIEATVGTLVGCLPAAAVAGIGYFACLGSVLPYTVPAGLVVGAITGGASAATGS